jgi:Fe-S cluster assembly protein SufD
VTQLETQPSASQTITPLVSDLSRSRRFTSYDVEAFEVPGGREEEWRFTPMRRLHGLHDGSAVLDGTATITVAPDGDAGGVGGVTVETVQRGDARLGDGGEPADRVAAMAWSSCSS